MLFTFILGLFGLISPIAGDEPCRGCRPVEYIVSPGIGIELAMNYGTVSAQLHDGTLVDIGKVEGSEEYSELMKQFAHDASIKASGEEPTIPYLDFEFQHPPYDPRRPDASEDLGTIGNLIKAAMKPFQGFLADANAQREEPEPLPPADQYTKPLLEMVTSLTQKAKDAYPDAAKFVFFGTPETLREDSSILPRVRLACRLAGYEEWGQNAGSTMLAVSDYFKFAFESDEMDFHLPKEARALVVHHTDAALSLAILSTDDGVVHNLGKIASYVKPPYDPQDPEARQEYARNSRSAILSFLETEQDGNEVLDVAFDKIYLLGEQGSETEFVEAVEDLVKTFMGGEGGPTIQATDERESTFAAARGAAQLARYGLRNNFDGCIPNDDCPQPQSEEPSTEAPTEKGEL